MTELLIPKSERLMYHKNEIKNLLNAVISSCKDISRLLRNGPQSDPRQTRCTNSTGDIQHTIDVITNEMLIENIKSSNSCAVIVSEENEDPIIMEDEVAGPYCIAFDPLDGSSNIDCNIPTGTIFAIWERSETVAEISENDILKTPQDILCCGYCIYSAATELVIVFDGEKPDRYVLDQVSNKFNFISHLEIPAKSKKICSVNQGNMASWDNTTKWIVKAFNKNGYSSRYVGSLVADIHRTLLYGGIYMYPSITKPKLRLLYEVAPMTKIIASAGGTALSGIGIGLNDLLHRTPKSVHEKTDVICGSQRDIDTYRNLSTFSELMSKQNFKIEDI